MLVLGEVESQAGRVGGGWDDSNMMVAELNYDKKRVRVAARPACRLSQSATLLTDCRDVKCNQQPPPPRAGVPWLW